MKTTKTTLPKKPVTKRDKHFYDLGAKQQAEVFNNTYGHLEGEILAKTPRKELLNDYQEPITNDSWLKFSLYVIAFTLFVLAVHEVVMWVLK